MPTMDYHYETMGRILSHLVNSGLSRIDLGPEDAMTIMTEREGDEEEVLVVFSDVLHWMLREGLIAAHNVQEYDGGYSFNQVQLTSKGIAMIRAEPKDADIGESIEKRVSGAKPKDLEASVYTKIGSFAGGFAGGFTKAIGGS